jgi:hypothetical protein
MLVGPTGRAAFTVTFLLMQVKVSLKTHLVRGNMNPRENENNFDLCYVTTAYKHSEELLIMASSLRHRSTISIGA